MKSQEFYHWIINSNLWREEIASWILRNLIKRLFSLLLIVEFFSQNSFLKIFKNRYLVKEKKWVDIIANRRFINHEITSALNLLAFPHERIYFNLKYIIYMVFDLSSILGRILYKIQNRMAILHTNICLKLSVAFDFNITGRQINAIPSKSL